MRYLSSNCLVTWHFKLDSNEAAVRNGTLWWQSLETQNENGLSYLPLIIEKTLKNLGIELISVIHEDLAPSLTVNTVTSVIWTKW